MNFLEMDNLASLTLPCILSVGMAVIILSLITEHRKLNNGWRSFAVEHQLQFTLTHDPETPKVTGVYRGRTLCLAVDKRLPPWPMRQQRKIYTQATVPIINTYHLTLTCAYPGVLFMQDSFAKRLKRPGPIRTGDQRFDALYTFRGEPSKVIAQLAQSANVRSALLQLKPTIFHSPNLRIHEDSLTLEWDELLYNAKQLQKFVDDTCDLAELFEAESAVLAVELEHANGQRTK